jgi:hypothetical protein
MLGCYDSYKYVTPTPQVGMTLCEKKNQKIAPTPSVILLMRVRVLLLTIGIGAKLSCKLNISCSSPSHASPCPQLEAGSSIVPTHPSSPAHTSNSSSKAASSPRRSPSLARHVRRTVSALGCSSVRHRQEVEVVVAEERERAVRATRLAVAELATTSA